VSSKARTFAVVCALGGLAAMLWAAYVHHRLLFDPRYASFCDVNSTVSCSEVLLSRYSTAYGVPIAIYGAIWFTGILVLLGAATWGGETLRENVPGYVFALSTAGLAVVLYLAYVSFAVLKVYCPLCLTADAAVVGLFIVSGAATSFPMTTLPKRFLRDVRTSFVTPAAIAVIVLFLVGAGSAVALFARESAIAEGASASAEAQPSTDRRSDFQRFWAAQPRVPLIVPNEGAKVLIVDFSDFQCPYCRQAYAALKPIIDKYNAVVPNTVRLVLKDFPLDSKCNASIQNGGPHPFACEAAVAVRLAKAKGREQALEDHLFANQPDFSSENIRKWARDIGQVTDFDAKYPSTIEGVKGDIAFGHTLQVNATPTMFINGVKIPGVLYPRQYDEAIALELQRADAQK
jgi:uncharacterized membrane protein/protein-disulfide isomerase